MTRVEALRDARDAVLAGHFLLAGGLDAPSLLLEASGGDAELAAQLLELLDACTPRPFTFQLFADGARATESGCAVGFVYGYDRKPSEIAAIIGKACALAAREEAA